MMPSFNTAGPCVPGEHYMLPPEERLGRVMRLIEEHKYFVLYAGHQTGKTTCAQWLVDHYNKGDRYTCAWVDLEEAREEPEETVALPTILANLDRALRRDLPGVTPPDRGWDQNPATALRSYLQDLCARVPRPLVLFLDEADGLVGHAMVSFLTQLRSGYLDRARTPFPHSLVLAGRKQVRDYAFSLSERRVVSWLGTSSPFNITAEATTLHSFTSAQVAMLLLQHTQVTGQRFLPEAVEAIFYLSQGHPWLVNALADQIVNRDVEDRSAAITAAHVEAAKEAIILDRRTHIDSLIARLHEPRVQHIIEPMLIGQRAPSAGTLNDDFAYVLGLGLLSLHNREYVIANPIYKEVIPRALSFDQQAQLHQKPARYVRLDGRLDLPRLMKDWQKFWRQDGQLAAEGFAYREAGPHLMLMAFLQRIINGGGRIEREYALGRGALDLMIFFAGERHAIEVKLRRDTQTGTEALEQLLGYLDEAGLAQGWLVIFDLRKEVPWSEKLTMEEVEAEGKRIWVVGC